MIQWNDSFATGHETIDNDHKKLIEALNRLETALHNGAAKEQIGDIIAFFNEYVREHFAREEAHMLEIGCPAHADNCKAHAEFAARLDGWVEKLDRGASTAVVVEVYRETASWIRNHILKIDCQLKNCRR